MAGVTLPDSRVFAVIERWIFLALMLVAGLAWGLKLEFRNDSQAEMMRLIDLRVSEMDKTINRGILPLTEERIKRLGQDMAVLGGSLHDLSAQIEKLSIEIERMKLMWARTDLERTKRR